MSECILAGCSWLLAAQGLLAPPGDKHLFRADLSHAKAPAVQLTRPGEAGYYGGAEVRQLYALLAQTEGWWNADGDFTLAEFNGLLILHEASLIGPEVENLIAEVVGRHLWAGGRGGNPPYCPQWPCGNGAFNFWARYAESAHRLVTAFVRGAARLEDYQGPNVRAGRLTTAQTMARAAQLGNRVLNPPPAWRLPDNNAPFGWGNDRAWYGALAAHRVELGLGPSEVVYRAGGSFVIYTPNQAHCYGQYVSGAAHCWN